MSKVLMSSRSRCLTLEWFPATEANSSIPLPVFGRPQSNLGLITVVVPKCHLDDAMAVDRLVHFTVQALSLFMGVALIGRSRWVMDQWWIVGTVTKQAYGDGRWWVSFKIHQNPSISFWRIPTLPLQDPPGPSYLTTNRLPRLHLKNRFSDRSGCQTWKVWESYVSCPRWVQLRYWDLYGRDWTILDLFWIYSPKCTQKMHENLQVLCQWGLLRTLPNWIL